MKIFFQKGINLKVFETKETNYRKLSTGRDCFFPKNNWVPLSVKINRSTKNHKIGSPYLLFFCISDQLRLQFHNETLPYLNDGVSSDLIKSAAIEMLKSSFIIDFHEFRSVDVKITPSNQESTAYNYNIDEYLGLHIDTHDQTPNSHRSNAWSLIAINLGTNIRYLNFVSLSFSAICEKLMKKKETFMDWNEIKMPDLVCQFFNQFPNHPIIRVELPPSYGYIACTQNFIHDGATNNKGDDDINMLISGNFDIVNLDFIKSVAF